MTDLEQLITSLSHTQASIRLDAQRQLIELGDSAVDPLVRTMRTGDNFQRAHAAIALGRLNDIRALGPLLTMRHHENLLIRIDSAKTLGMFDNAYSKAALIDWLHVEDNVLVQMAIVQVLARIPAWTVFEALSQMLDRTHSPSLRAVIIRVLGEQGDPRAAGTLFRYLEDEDEHVQQEALIALEKLGFNPDKE